MALDAMSSNGSSGAAQALLARFHEYAEKDQERNQLILELLDKLADSEKVINRLKLDLEDQTRSRTGYQQDARDLLEKNKKWEQLINRDGFVVVLIDGDGAKFLDGLLQDPKVGAVEAASRLKQAVKDYLEATALAYMDLPVLVRVYANLNGLAKSLRLSKVIQYDDDMRVFAETFTNSRWEFDFVNVGHGKENADSKLRKMLNHFMKNFQCKRVFFAGCHDNSYLHDLREHAGDERVVLVETTAAEPGFRSLNLPITRFDNVFRAEPLLNETKHTFQMRSLQQSQSPAASNLPRRSVDDFISPPPGLPKPSSTIGISSRTASEPASTQSPPPGLSAQAAPPRTISPTSTTQSSPATASVTLSGNGGVSVRYPPSYASAGGDTGYQNVTVKGARKKIPKIIEYNANGYRLDPVAKHPGFSPAQESYKTKFDRIRPRVFCNDYYLTGSCKWADKCDKDHSTKLTPDELAIHRYKARTSPCPNGPSCDDYNCYLSHHCMHDPNCTRRHDCRFSKTKWGDLHLTREELTPATRWTEGEDFPQNLL